MRFGAVAENPIERLIARLNLAPRPLLEPRRPIRFRTVPGVGIQAAGKPG